jgi:hypothetical protein
VESLPFAGGIHVFNWCSVNRLAVGLVAPLESAVRGGPAVCGTPALVALFSVTQSDQRQAHAQKIKQATENWATRPIAYTPAPVHHGECDV